MSDIRFQTKPVVINNWIVIRLPEDASKMLPSRGQVMIKGTINGFKIHTALEPDGKGGHWLDVDKNMQKAAGISLGKAASLDIESTKDWPEPYIPSDWKSVIDTNPDIKALWLDVTPMARWEWLRWINSTKEPATRKKRIEVSCSKLRAGMRRPCCFNRSMCCVPDVSKSGILLDPS